MEVMRTRDPRVVKYVKALVTKFIETEKIEEFDAPKFLQYLRKAIQTPNCFVWVGVEGEDVIGIVVGNVLGSLAGDYVMLSCYFAESDEILSKIFDSVAEWTSENNMNKNVLMTKFPKKFKNMGFEVKEHLLEKVIGEQNDKEYDQHLVSSSVDTFSAELHVRDAGRSFC